MATAQEVFFPSAVSMVGVAKGMSATPSSFISKTGTSANTNTHYPGPFDYTNNGGQFYTGNAATTSGTYASLSQTNRRSDISVYVPASVYAFTIPDVGGTAYSYLNGAQTSSQTIQNYADGGNSLRIGNRNELSLQGNLYCPEIILFSSVLSTSDRNTLETNQKNFYISADANFTSLNISSGTLSPVFASATIAYSSSVANSVSSVTVTPAVNNANAKVQVRVNSGTYATMEICM